MESLTKKLIFKKYRIRELICKTQISSIYEGINEKTKEPVAMKFEKIGDKYSFLESEAYILLLLKGIGIPNVISYGKVINYKLLIEELLGKSIYFIWSNLDNEKNILTDICLIAIQCLDRLEYIHSKNIVHKDIKPANFLVGRKDPNLIYIIDFGMSGKYRSSRTGKHIKFQKLKKVNGTLRYMSINSCKGYEFSRRDDLESLGYMLIFLLKNNLPWVYVENKKISSKLRLEKVLSIKSSITPEELCEKLPNEFCQYIKYCRKLDFEQEPNYDYLRSLFFDVLNSKKKLNNIYSFDSMSFSWLNKGRSKKLKSETIFLSQFSSRISNINKGKDNTHKRLFIHIKSSIEKKRKESPLIENTDISNSHFINKSFNFSKIHDFNFAKNKNDENVISITNDSKKNHKINKNILFNINKNNKKQVISQKNAGIKKTQLKNINQNILKTKKLNNKFYNNRTILNKKILPPFSIKDKITNIQNPKKDVNCQTKTNNNFNSLKVNIPNNSYLKQSANFTERPNINYNLIKDQRNNNRNVAKSISFDYQANTQFLNNKNHIKDSSFNKPKNIINNLIKDIRYSSIFGTERKKEK